MSKITVKLIGQYDPLGINVGGMEIYLESLAKELQKYCDVKIYGWSKSKTNIDNFNSVLISKRLTGWRFTGSLFFNKNKINVLNGDILIFDRPDRIYPFINSKAKIISVLHGAHGKNISLKKGKLISLFYNILERKALKRADVIISVSDENKEYFIKKYPILKNKIQVIPVGIPDNLKPNISKDLKNQYGYKNSDEIYLYIGRLEKEKQVDLIIKPFIDKNIDIRKKLLIVGDGKERKNLENISKENRNIKFLGSVRHDEIKNILNLGDFLILYSKFEGLPTVILESLACGVPVISNGVGGIADIIKNNYNGFIVNDLKEFIIKNRKTKESLTKNCIKSVKIYRWTKVGKRVWNVIQN